MNKHGFLPMSLALSRTGRLFRLSALAVAVTFFTLLNVGAIAAQEKPKETKPVAQKTQKKVATEKSGFGYTAHQSIELGGRITNVSGNEAIWKTMVNESSGMRILDQSLELRTIDPHKTPFFDTLSTSAHGFGGDEINLAHLNASKGKIWDFAGSFRRDRNFVDFNQFVNSLLTNGTSTQAQSSLTYNSGSITTGPVLVPEPNSLHVYDTVRYNSDGVLTLLPISRVSGKLGWNHGTHEGPSLITDHGSAGDQQVFQWFRNSQDTFSASLEAKLFKGTSVSYDQYVVIYKDDSYLRMPTVNDAIYNQYGAQELFPVAGSNGSVYASVGVELYNLASIKSVNGTTTPATTSTSYTCGNVAVTGGGKTVPSTVVANNQIITGGVMNQFCKATTALSQTQPIRGLYPTEQFRFNSNTLGWLTVNGRVSYSGGENKINNFNLTYDGFGDTKPAYTSSTGKWNAVTIGTVKVGNGTNGQFAWNRRSNLNVDFGAVAEPTKSLYFTENFSYFKFRTEGYSNNVTTTYALPTNEGLLTGGTVPSLLSTTGSTGVTTTVGTPSTVQNWLDQRIAQNTFLVNVIASPKVKLSGGVRFRTRMIDYDSLTAYVPSTNMLWHEVAGLFGGVYEPTRMLRITGNYEIGSMCSANATTVSNTFTREAPNQFEHLKIRAIVKPTKQFTLSFSDNDSWGRNSDSYVNHTERNRDVSFGAVYSPFDKLSIDLAYAYDDVFSRTDTCYAWVPDVNFQSYPTGATNAGTCTAAASPNGGAATLFLSNGYYDAPSNFGSAVINYRANKYFRFNGGARYTSLDGKAEALNPFQLPGTLQSRTLAPFADIELKIAEQWAWHGNWAYNGYGEQGSANAATGGVLSNNLPARNMHGNVLTLGVKYAF